ncbi:MAG: fibronectin type III domain-containing protein [Candidatus Komeilibacteria bacterium]|nr:fibronectin type III domain-containing protein [Candidatus Komeilibacteria bacterium]
MKTHWFVILIVGLLVGPNFSLASTDFYFTNLRVMANSRSATIIWSVNQPATGVVSFGLTNSYGNWIQDTRFENYHETLLVGLKPNSVYHFSIQSRSSQGAAVVSDDYQFTTKNGNDGVPPEISKVRVSFITANSITVTWETDEESNSTVYFDTQDGNLRSSRSDGRQLTKHDITVNGLKTATRYFFQVGSKDASGIERRSGSYIATTAFGNDQFATDLQIVSIEPFNRQLSTDPHGVIFSINTNRPVSGRVRYGEKTKNYNAAQDLLLPRTTATRIELTNLKSDTVYYYYLDFTDVLGKHLVSPEYTFRTPPVNILRSPGTEVKAAETSPAEVAVYAYDQPRLALAEEQRQATSLRQALVKYFGTRRVNRISKVNWQTLVKAYVYGDYPVVAIRQAIKWGGFTVHPAIPWSIWQTTTTYNNYINR